MKKGDMFDIGRYTLKLRRFEYRVGSKEIVNARFYIERGGVISDWDRRIAIEKIDEDEQEFRMTYGVPLTVNELLSLMGLAKTIKDLKFKN